jgi:tripartite ATP-independent transporter DctM subunit
MDIFVTFVILGLLILMLLYGIPVFASLGISSVVAIVMTKGVEGLTVIPEIYYEKMDNFVLIAIPLFILMGEILFHTGIGSDLYKMASRWTNRIPGGLAMGTVVASTVFGAMCGVSVAGAATIGAFAVPEMLRRGYDRSLATGSVAASGALALLIPPSIGFILYGAVADESVGRLFIAGILPGIVLAICMMIYIFVVAVVTPHKAPIPDEKITWKMRFESLFRCWAALFLIILVLGSIYFGIATPTESAAIGAAGAFFLAFFVYKSLNWKVFSDILLSTMKTTGMILFIFINAMLFGYILTRLQVPQHLASLVAEAHMAKWAVLTSVIILLIFLGMFLDGASVILIATPILLPVMEVIGYDKIWFGVILMITIEMAVITPPVGLNLYVIKSIAPDTVTLKDIITGAMPFVFVEILVIIFFILFPKTVLWLPMKM